MDPLQPGPTDTALARKLLYGVQPSTPLCRREGAGGRASKKGLQASFFPPKNM